MACAMIQFRVPENTDELHDILYDLGGESSDIELRDQDGIAAALTAANGKLVEITFNDEPDPLDVILQLADALDRQNAAYFATSDAYAEQSRGDRFLGRVLVNIGEGRVDLNVPYEYGEPKLDHHTLIAAGMDKEKAMAVEKAMSGDPLWSPGPR